MDISQMNEALGLASSAVSITGKATSTIAAIKGLFDGDTKSDNSEAASLLNNLATELTAANMMNVQLSEALRALSQELQRQDEFETEKARYEMFQTPKGDIAFRLKSENANGQPIHFICPVCLNKHKLISFMRGQHSLHCQADADHWVDYNDAPSLSAQYRDNDW